jgi:hypothetical protein
VFERREARETAECLPRAARTQSFPAARSRELCAQRVGQDPNLLHQSIGIRTAEVSRRGLERRIERCARWHQGSYNGRNSRVSRQWCTGSVQSRHANPTRRAGPHGLRENAIGEVARKYDERTGRQCIFEDERAGVCFENIVTPVLSMDGRVEKVAIIAIDITGRKRAEEALQDAKQQTELYLDLLGHDINNMHQIALGYLELARSKHPEIRHQEYLDKPIEALQRSSRLIQNVRKLQKLKEDSTAPEAVDLIRVLRDIQREYGESSVRETVELILKAQRRWDDLIQTY